MFRKDELENWLQQISKHIHKPVNIYLIGGGAMSFKNLKAITKDIDIIVRRKNELDMLDKAIRQCNYELMTNLEDEFYLTALAVYKKDDSRIDIFLKQVGKMLRLTDSMIKRAEVYNKFGKLSIYTVTNEDIFLFKSMTPRPGDIDDCQVLIETNLDYKSLYDEIQEQTKHGDKWYFWTFEKICSIENQSGTAIPIKNKILSLVEKNWKDRPADFMNDVTNVEIHITNNRLLNDLANREKQK